MIGAATLAEMLRTEPKVPKYTATDAQQEQRRAVAGNTQMLPETIAQTGALNTAQFANIDKLLAQASGGAYARLRDKFLSNLGTDFEGGDITGDLMRQAGVNMGRGVAGSPFGAMSNLRVGYDAQQANKRYAGAALTDWTSRVNNLYQPVNVASMFARNSVSPAEQIATTMANNENQFNRDWVSNQVKAEYSAGSRWARAISAESSSMDSGGGIGGMMGGGGGGGGM